MAYEVIAASRGQEQQGTSASRRLRRTGRLPGIVYGGGKDAVPLDLDHNTLFYALKEEAFHSSILTLVLDGKKETVLVRDVNYHPWKPVVLHVDFQRVNANEKIVMHIPLHFLNAEEAPAVKLHGGSFNYIINEVEVSCLPADLPEFIDVDLSTLQAGDTLHLSHLVMNKGVELVALTVHGDDQPILTVAGTRGGAEKNADSAE